MAGLLLEERDEVGVGVLAVRMSRGELVVESARQTDAVLQQEAKLRKTGVAVNVVWRPARAPRDDAGVVLRPEDSRFPRLRPIFFAFLVRPVGFQRG